MRKSDSSAIDNAIAEAFEDCEGIVVFGIEGDLSQSFHGKLVEEEKEKFKVEKRYKEEKD